MVPPGGKDQTASVLGDFDGDGIQDFVIGTRDGTPSVVLYRHTNDGWVRHVVDEEKLPIEAGGAVSDIDGDGDLDLVLGGDWRSNRVWWWENPAPDFDANESWTRRPIKAGGSPKHHDQIFGDFDADGTEELIFWNQRGGVLWSAEIPASPHRVEEWSRRAIFSWTGEVELEGLARADIDGDGRVDLVGGGRWFEYVPDRGEFVPHVIDEDQARSRVAADDLDADGRTEIVFAPGESVGSLTLYEVGPDVDRPDRWRRTRLLDREVVNAHSLAIGDVDGDGHRDIFCAEMFEPGNGSEATAWILLGDGTGEFRPTVHARGIGHHESRLADLDGDGDLDILQKPFRWRTPRVDLYMNQGWKRSESYCPSGSSWCRYAVDASLPERAPFVRFGDLDGDGLVDILVGRWWYRNPGSISGNWERQRIAEGLDRVAITRDLDGDGDLDVLGTAGPLMSDSSTFVWARNEGGGQFTTFDHVGTVPGDFLQGAVGGRFLESGSWSIALSWHAKSDGVMLLTVPEDPEASWTWRRISSFSQEEDLSAGDIDGDGDTDLLLGTFWLENVGGSQEWPAHRLGEVEEGKPDRNELVDINGDGRLDAVVGLEEGTHLYVFEAPPDVRQRWTRRTIARNVGGGYSLDVGELTAENATPEIVLGEHRRDPVNRMLIFSSPDEGATWRSEVVDPGTDRSIDHHDGARLVDLNGDSVMEIVSIGWTNPAVWIYEQTDRTTALPAPKRDPYTTTLDAHSELGPNVPNPFNASTKLQFTLERGDAVEVAVFDLLGRKVDTLIDATLLEPGPHQVRWNPSPSVPTGTYFGVLRTSSGVSVRALTLLK